GCMSTPVCRAAAWSAGSLRGTRCSGSGQLLRPVPDFLIQQVDEQIKLRQLHRVVSLFMLAKQKQISLVLRAVAVKEQLIFGLDQARQLFIGGRCAGAARIAEQGAGQLAS